MKSSFLRFFSIVLLAFLIHACTTQTPVRKPPVKPQPPKKTQPALPTETSDDFLKVNLPSLNREFRGVWIASVANINWPSRKDLSTAQQKQEAINLLDMLQRNNFNAVILQVRPSGDALYKSKHEPWSYFLTGEIGRAPSPYYDPLEFWIQEAHKRGLELHVWLNPYRAHHTNGGKVTEKSIVRRMPENIVRLKNGMYWFDPADPVTQDHASAIVKDLVERYDIDGVHFDDYFYPYATYNNGADFPDSKSWNAYRKSGGTLSRADFRRANVNKFVERIYREIKAEKNYVKFGISPFGIWKPGYPAGITGSSQYDELYADAKLWLNQGWVDYFTPQLYWPIASKGQPFGPLLKWWQSENTRNRHLWPGLNTVEVKVRDRPAEIVDEIELSRSVLKNDPGEVHWSIAGLTKNPEMLPALKNGPYKEQALIPRSPWLKTKEPGKPDLQLSLNGSGVRASWSVGKDAQDVFLWAVFMKYDDTWETEILPKDMQSKAIPLQKHGKNLSIVAVKAIDRLSNESGYVARRVK